jgi:hypothetical protein
MGRFEFFSKIRGDIRKSKCSTGIRGTGGKLELRISPRIFRKKFETARMGYAGAWGKLIHEKT